MSDLSPAQWERITALFDELHALPTHAREARLAAIHAEDTAVGDEVRALLDADSDEHFLSAAPGANLNLLARATSRLLDRTLGAYRVEREIARGGMGVVYIGRHVDPSLEKRVAIKTLAIGLDRPELAWRFRRERQILAKLEHPNIATLYDGGATDDGTPYLVMEYVDGERIDVWCNRNHQSITARLDLFRQVCAAVQFAHTKLIIHRDLKPGNILVTDGGVVKLLDFGIAKLAVVEDDTEGERTEFTRAGGAPLTTAFASPEQLRGEDVTTASDVYSLGVILHRLLSGGSPHVVEPRAMTGLRDAGAAAAPRLPSETVTAEHAQHCGLSSAAALRTQLRGELDAIVSMALRHEPGRRYASAEALATDVLRYLKGSPVQARPDTFGYRVRKFVRRERALVAGATVAAVALLGGTVVAVRSARAAAAEADRANRTVTFLQSVVGAGDVSIYSSILGDKDITLRDVIDSTGAQIAIAFPHDDRTRADLYTALARSLRRFNRYEQALRLLDSARILHTRVHGDVSNEVAEDMTLASLFNGEIGLGRKATTLVTGAVSRYRQLPPASGTAGAARSIAFLSNGQLLNDDETKAAEALPFLDEARRTELALAEPRAPVLASIESNRGIALMRLQQFEAGDSAFASAVDLLAPDTVRHAEDLSVVLTNWGWHLGNRGAHAKAAALKRRGLGLISRAMGADHLQTAVIQSRLAHELIFVGEHPEAKQLLDMADRTMRASSTYIAGELAYVQRCYLDLALAQGDLSKARTALLAGQRLLPDLEGDRSDFTLDFLLGEAALLAGRGDSVPARRVLDSALTLARGGYPPGSYRRGRAEQLQRQFGAGTAPGQ